MNHHQNICKKSHKKPGPISPSCGSVRSSSSSKEQQISPRPAIKSFLGPEVPCDSRASEASDFLEAILCSGVSCAPDSPVRSASSYKSGSGPCHPVPVSLSEAQSKPQPKPKPQPQPVPQTTAQGKPVRKPPPSSATNPYPFVPTLKTRSQKKLDQIMLKHSLKKQMLKECEEMRTVPRKGAWWKSRRSGHSSAPARHPGTYTSQANFCAALGLGRSKDIKRDMSKEKEHQEVDLDCQIIMVEGPLSSMLGQQQESCDSFQQAATSPRSSKSLMSQLCRDAEESGRRKLSFRFLEDEWADKEALEEGRDPQQMSLLSIEFSSPLGVRIKKYMAGEGVLNIVKDPEVFCKTENMEDSYGKLRVRANDYRVTFRRKRRASRFVHNYKFNKSDRREFKRLLQTGLNARSRRLQRQLSSCSVSLKRMPAAEIRQWTEGKKIIISEKIIVDDDICITQVDIPESQMKKALSQERNLAVRYRPGPKCFAGLGRRHSSNTLSRPPMAPYAAPSPPHVPNIFRNRSSHTPSPPRPSSFNRAVPASGFNGHPSQAQTSHGGHRVFPSQSGSSVLPQPHHRGLASSSQAHLTQHRSLAPSIHERVPCLQPSAGSSGSSSTPVFTGHNSPNRRKQQLTQVRRDEADPAVRPSQSHVNPFSRRPPSESLSSPQQRVMNLNGQRPPPMASASSAAMVGRKLSNFDHFSIRNGKLSPSASASQRQQQQSSSSRQPPQAVLHRSRPLADWGSNCHQRIKHVPGVGRSPQVSTLLPVPGTARPVSVIQPPQNRLQQRHHKPGQSQQALRKPTPGVAPVKDDDVLEVICIDDD